MEAVKPGARVPPRTASPGAGAIDSLAGAG